MKLLDQSAQTNWKFIAIVAFVAVFLTGGILMLIPQFEEPTLPLSQQNNSQIVTPNSTVNEVEGWQTYRSDEFGFEIEYPEGLTVRMVELDDPFFVLKVFDAGEIIIGPRGYWPRGQTGEELNYEFRNEEISLGGVVAIKNSIISNGEIAQFFIRDFQLQNLAQRKWEEGAEILVKVYDSTQIEVIDKILSTFRFVG